MPGKPTASLSHIVEMRLTDQGDDQVINGSHDFCRVANRHAGSIFFEGNIEPIMQSSFNAPMGAPGRCLHDSNW